MTNSALVGLLGLLFATCLAVNGMAKQAYEDERAVNAQISSMEESVKAAQTEPSPFSLEYDISELAENYPPPEVSRGKTIIPVPVINQYPELPVGCEITSVTAVLNYLGYKVDKVYMQENFLEDSYNFKRIDENSRYGPDPSKVFVGNPKDTGFGCFAPVVVDSYRKFFRFMGSKNYAIQLNDPNGQDLELLLDNGVPVVVWASINMKPFRYTANNEWILDTTKELFRWPGNAHVLVLVGYDDEYYYFSDCNDKEEISRYRKEDFLTRWEQFGKQAVIVKLEDEK